MQNFSMTPHAMLASLWLNRSLVRNLVIREVVGRYRGSALGLLWSFFNPVFLLTVYTFVFSVIFKARWGTGGGSKAEFALVLFSGLMLYNLFAECVNRAPTLILNHSTYVKKVVFPLEILPWVIYFSALFHMLVSFIVWLLFSFVIFGFPPVTVVLFPFLLLPLTLLAMGFSWLLASLGVYLRDVSHVVGIMTMALMFLTPIFYPISAIPDAYQTVLYANPLTFIIEQARNLLIFGTTIEYVGFISLSVVSFFISWLGFAWFQKTRKGFADVL